MSEHPTVTGRAALAMAGMAVAFLVYRPREAAQLFQALERLGWRRPPPPPPRVVMVTAESSRRVDDAPALHEGAR